MGGDPMEQRPVGVAVIDDHQVVIDGVRAWAAADPTQRVRIVLTSGTPDCLLPRPPGVDVVLLDLELAGVLVLDRVAALSDAGHRVVVFSAHGGPSVVSAALDAGACAYLTKDEAREHCIDTLVAVATDRPYVTRSLAGGMLADPRLSGREREALLLWFQGMDMAAVARRMTKTDGSGEAITKDTVKQYIDRARVKYARAGRSVASRFALLARAIEDGLIRPEDVGGYRSTAAQ
jgi:two-component system, NarL family, nitrate/nitrite response regulator NarL